MSEFEYEKYITNSPFLENKNVDFEGVCHGGTPKYYEKNATLFVEGARAERVYLVKSGRVRVSVCSEDGREQCLYIAGGGTLLGETGVQEVQMASAVVVASGYIYELNIEEFVHKNTQLCADDSARKLRCMAQRIKELSFYDAQTRVLSALEFMSAQFCDPKGAIKIKFTHQELADLTGLSRVSISNMLKKLANSKIVEKKNGLYLLYGVKSEINGEKKNNM